MVDGMYIWKASFIPCWRKTEDGFSHKSFNFEQKLKQKSIIS